MSKVLAKTIGQLAPRTQLTPGNPGPPGLRSRGRFRLLRLRGNRSQPCAIRPRRLPWSPPLAAEMKMEQAARQRTIVESVHLVRTQPELPTQFLPFHQNGGIPPRKRLPQVKGKSHVQLHDVHPGTQPMSIGWVDDHQPAPLPRGRRELSHRPHAQPHQTLEIRGGNIRCCRLHCDGVGVEPIHSRDAIPPHPRALSGLGQEP
ncbi:MAG: hypothetical protein BWY79_02103 [Actinobacteria bacterium ADurb.Bin444]|nr:MAG: hypothetical protein BWY79_02103 [Actinobacteria bacterium ADurb.Bin444]